MNNKYYIDRLDYKIGEIVLYMGKEHEITHINKEGLVNLKDGWFFFFGVNKNMLYKIK